MVSESGGGNSSGGSGVGGGDRERKSLIRPQHFSCCYWLASTRRAKREAQTGRARARDKSSEQQQQLEVRASCFALRPTCDRPAAAPSSMSSTPDLAAFREASAPLAACRAEGLQALQHNLAWPSERSEQERGRRTWNEKRARATSELS